MMNLEARPTRLASLFLLKTPAAKNNVAARSRWSRLFLSRLSCLLTAPVLSFGLPAMLSMASADAGEIAITINNLRNDKGMLLIAVCDSTSFLTATCAYEERLHAGVLPPAMVFKDVAPGRYAVQVIHDENASGKLDSNAIGLPKEGYGFSNNPRSLFGPPRFDAAAISVTGDDVETRIDLRYLFD